MTTRQDPSLVGRLVAAVRERQVGYVPDVDSDFLAFPAESFACAQPEDGVGLGDNTQLAR